MRARQLSFSGLNCPSMIGVGFGGSKFRGNPKGKRPFSKKHHIHIVLKSSFAVGANSFLAVRHREYVNRIVRSLAAKSGIRLYDFVNVGNHLHLMVKASHRSALSKFLRSLSGILPRRILNAQKGRPLSLQKSRDSLQVNKNKDGLRVNEGRDGLRVNKSGDGLKVNTGGHGRGLGAREVHNLQPGDFWDGRPFSKIVAEGLRPFAVIRRYFEKNRRQAQQKVEGFDLFDLDVLGVEDG